MCIVFSDVGSAQAAVAYKAPLALPSRLETMACRSATKAGAAGIGGGGCVTKVSEVDLRTTPANGGKPLATLGRNEERVVIGNEQSGYITVLGSEAMDRVTNARSLASKSPGFLFFRS